MPDLTLTEVLLRILSAMVFGVSIGVERGYKRRAAGMRTHALVCVGSTLVMTTNQYLNIMTGIGDPARLGAQVISGIGFLGVGTIIIDRRQQVRGLTTAASLWASACMGLALGSGFYIGAVSGFFCIIFINVALSWLERFLFKISKYIELNVITENYQTLMGYKNFLSEQDLSIKKFVIVKPYDLRGKSDNRASANIRLKISERGSHGEITDMIGKYEGLLSFEEIL